MKRNWNFLGIRDSLQFFRKVALNLSSKIEIIWKNSSLKQRLINVARQIWVKIDCILRMLRALGRKYSVLKILWQITYHFEAWNKKCFMSRPRSFFNGCCKCDINNLWCDINIHKHVSTVTLAVKKEYRWQQQFWLVIDTRLTFLEGKASSNTYAQCRRIKIHQSFLSNIIPQDFRGCWVEKLDSNPNFTKPCTWGKEKTKCPKVHNGFS